VLGLVLPRLRNRYGSSWALSSVCVTCPSIWPSCSTAIFPALRIVGRQWAMTTAVRLTINLSLTPAGSGVRSPRTSTAAWATLLRRTCGWNKDVLVPLQRIWVICGRSILAR